MLPFESNMTPVPKVAELLQELIRFESINPPGREFDCVHYVRDLLLRHGVAVQIHTLDENRPNLIARIPGAGIAPPLLLYGHADVVPVDGQNWSVPPFEGRIQDGFVWGRGALDMKGGLAMQIVAFLKTAKTLPPGDLILAVVSDEERGGQYGAEYLAANHAHAFDGVKHAIGEFGGFTMSIGGQKIMPIQISEKAYCCIDLVFHGVGGHAATPPSATAALDVGRFLVAMAKHPMPIRVSEPARQMLSAMADLMKSPSKKILFNQLKRRSLAPYVLRAVGPQLRRVLEPLLRTVITPTIISGGVSRNVLPHTISVKCDCRLIQGDTLEDLENCIRRYVPSNCEIEIRPSARITKEADSSQFPLLATIAQEFFPDVAPIPMLLPAVTDSRHFASLDIQTYGFLPMILPSGFDFMSIIHGADERVPVDGLEKGATAIASFIDRYRG